MRRRRRSRKESGVETWVHALGKLSIALTTTTEKLPVFITALHTPLHPQGVVSDCCISPPGKPNQQVTCSRVFKVTLVRRHEQGLLINSLMLE